VLEVMFKKIYHRIEKSLARINKRRRFIIAVGGVTFAVLITIFAGYDQILISIPIILISVYLFNVFAILEGIKKREWLMLFIIPVYFTLAFTSLYFFFPQRWLTRLPFLIIYAVCLYAIMLSQNIFNVGAQKSLQLYRAAFSVNYLFITIIAFICYNLILSFRLNFFQNGLIILIASIPLAVHFFWSSDPKETVDKDVIKYGLFVSVLIGEAGLAFSFISISSAVFALFLTALLYSLLGITQAHIQQTLYRERIREYLFVLGFVLVIVLLSISW